MKLIRAALFLVSVLVGTSNPAHASTTQLAVSGVGVSSRLAASDEGGDYAFAVSPATLRYGNASTGRRGIAVVPDPRCLPTAADASTVLLDCRNPAGTAIRAPLLLSTRTGAFTTPPGAAFAPNTNYFQIGRTWIYGQRNTNGTVATFINRITGQVIPEAPDAAVYDLDTSGTPTLRPFSYRRGKKLLSYNLNSPYTIQIDGSGHRLELVRGRTVVKVLSTCQTACGASGVAGHIAAWTEGDRVRRYSTTTKKTTTSTFKSLSSRARIQLAVQPRQVLAAVPQIDGRTRLYRLR